MIEIPSVMNNTLRRKRAADYLSAIVDTVKSDSIVARLEDLAKGNVPTCGKPKEAQG